MTNRRFYGRLLSIVLTAGVSITIGCDSHQQQPPATTQRHGMMDTLGDIARASIERKKRVAGALVSAVAGAGGSLLVGARHDKIDQNRVDEALEASARAERTPARPDDVLKAASADLNGDGFVTLDEVVALKRAGLSSPQMIDRLQRTQQEFELASWQEQYLRGRGVDDSVIAAMRTMNRGPAVSDAVATKAQVPPSSSSQPPQGG